MTIVSEKNEKQTVALNSVFAGGLLTVTKFVVGVLTGSMGIMSEAAHSLLDLVAAIMTFFAVKFGDRPADETHPYGHGKIESVSALVETGLLFVTSVWIIYEALIRLFEGGGKVEATWYAFAVVILSIVVDISRSRALSRVAKETNSQALEADALHFSSDIYSSGAVLIGLVFVYAGVPGADAVAAIAVAFFVTLAGYRLGKRTIDVLVDKAPDGLADQARAIAQDVSGIVQVDQVRVRPLGANAHIELFVAVHRKLSQQKTQEIIKNVQVEINRVMPSAEVAVHTTPITLDSETIVEKVQHLAVKNNLAVHKVIVDQLDDKQYISYDVEMADDLTIQAAHDLATILEEEIRSELGVEVELNSHIEPLKHRAILSSNVTDEELREITRSINDAKSEVAGITETHNILARKIGEKYFISFHCCAPRDLSLERVHELTNQFEHLLKGKTPAIKRVVIHVEPA